MKKTWVIALCAMTMAAAMMTGCGKNDENDSQNPAGNQGTVVTDTTYGITIKGTKVTPGMTQENLISAIGNADNTFEAPSCAGEGTDYTLTYGSIEIQTVPNGKGGNEVSLILIKDDLTSTDEGVFLGDSADKMTAAYGDQYTEKGSACIYTSGKVQLQFVFSGEEIVSIEYGTTE